MKLRFKKVLMILFTMAVCLLGYQNCSTTSGLYQSSRTVPLHSKVDLQILNPQGDPLLTWKFTPGSEVLVKIIPEAGKFCERSLVLSKEYENKWSGMIKSLRPVRGQASEADEVFVVKVDKDTLNVSGVDAKRLYDLMEATKLNHNLNVSHCESMKWSFNKVTIESLMTTKGNSRYLQVVELNVLGGNSAETVIKEEPIDVAMNSKDVFCDYTYREYKSNMPMLNLMFAANEFKSINQIGGRGLASLTSGDEQETVNENLLITIDGAQKIQAPEHSEFNVSLKRFISNLKTESGAQKTCAYAY